MIEQRVHFKMDLQTQAWVADAMRETWTATIGHSRKRARRQGLDKVNDI